MVVFFSLSRDFVQEVARMESPVLEHVTILIKDCFAPIADRDFDAILLIINITIKKNTNLENTGSSPRLNEFFSTLIFLNFYPMTMQIVVLLIQEYNPVIFLSVAHCIMCNSHPKTKKNYPIQGVFTTQFRNC